MSAAATAAGYKSASLREEEETGRNLCAASPGGFLHANGRSVTDQENQNRFGPSYLHQRDPRSALFAGYTGDQDRRSPGSANSGASGYGYPGTPNNNSNGHLGAPDPNRNAYRPATPNKKGQYSDAVLNELESQNDAQVAGILGKVRVLKDVSRDYESPARRTITTPPGFHSVVTCL